MRHFISGEPNMAACPLGLLLCKTLPGNRRVHGQPDESHRGREPAVEANVCGSEHPRLTCSRKPLEKSNRAVSTPRDGRECSGATWGEHCAGLQAI